MSTSEFRQKNFLILTYLSYAINHHMQNSDQKTKFVQKHVQHKFSQKLSQKIKKLKNTKFDQNCTWSKWSFQ